MTLSQFGVLLRCFCWCFEWDLVIVCAPGLFKLITQPISLRCPFYAPFFLKKKIEVCISSIVVKYTGNKCWQKEQSTNNYISPWHFAHTTSEHCFYAALSVLLLLLFFSTVIYTTRFCSHRSSPHFTFTQERDMGGQNKLFMSFVGVDTQLDKVFVVVSIISIPMWW